MKEILFATTNKGKIESLRNRLPENMFTITPVRLEIPEIQATTVKEICEAKAFEAYKQVRRPLVVQDSAFHITALNNFPGPYIKYISDTIGAEGLLKLMGGVEDRTCYVEQAITYIEREHTMRTFVKRGKTATIAKELAPRLSDQAWGVLWKIYIPHWSTKTLSEITKEEIELHERDKEDDSEFAQFAKWLLSN
jgi:XTP/dITP diphosphohydrolase